MGGEEWWHMEEKISDVVCKMHYIIARNFLNELYSSEIPYAIIKGCPLELFKNGSFSGRMINDIDILLDRVYASKVTTLLKEKGYSLPSNIHRSEYIAAISSSHQYPVYYKYVGDFYSQIDINFDVFWGEYQGKRFPISSLLEDAVDLDFCECHIKTLSPMKHLIVVILHHYKEMNSIFHLLGHNAIKPRLFEDIKNLIENNPHIFSPEKVMCECLSYKIVPYAYYLFYYANLYYGDSCLSEYVSALECKGGTSLLNTYGLSDSERKTWKIDFFDRFNEHRVKESILNQLNEEDKLKLSYNRKIFGMKNEG